MVKIGDYNRLEILRSTGVGMYVGAEEVEDILLPLKYIPENSEVGDEIDVFVYRDSEDRIIATTLKPKIVVNSFACLEVVDVNKMGVFFDIGLEKDLLVPSKEQNTEVRVGDKRIVHMYLDEHSERLIGSMKWRSFCFTAPIFEVNDKVEIMIGEKTDLGRNVLIEDEFYGLIYDNEIFETLEMGDIREAYVKTMREDGNIDVSLQELGYGHIVSSSDKLLELLKANDGVLEIGDKSSPEEIAALTGMSKKAFKKALGDLYKKKKVLLEKEQVRLV